MVTPKYLALITLCSVIAALTSQIAAREQLDLSHGWSFSLADPSGAEAPDFDDRGWLPVDAPHDWAFEAPYDPEAAQTDRGGYKPGGIGWYRRSFEAPQNWSEKNVELEFDGVYMNSQVWLNGQLVGGQAYGYGAFAVNLNHALQPGQNVIAVRVDNEKEPSARWYHGCGIYAPVTLITTDPTHIARESLFVRTPEVSVESATVALSASIVTPPDQSGKISLRTRISDTTGETVAYEETEVSNLSTEQSLTVSQPHLWSPDSPTLYTVTSQLLVDGRLVDTIDTRIGIRTLRWDAETGFYLNGSKLKLKGVADHLEAGPVGAASPKKLIRWKIELLKEMGVNAIRVAHNPQVPAFYDICDELGMMVMDEVFDGWRRKASEDYGARFFEDHWRDDLRSFIRRARNHPSIIIYSLGNETRGPVAKDLVAMAHSEDPTRLVTSGHSSSEHMDVFGVNGHSEKQSFYHEKRPDKAFIATEAPHTWQVRGYYRTRTWWRDGFPNKSQDPFPIVDLTEKEIFRYDWAPASKKTSAKQVFNSSYDNATVRISARKNWELLRDLPWYAGSFRWTGFDYLGEAGYVHGGWPFRAFMSGALDLAGFKKDLFYFYQSQWTEQPMVHILPHWTHPKMELGTKIPIWVYSNADEVELFLNGQSLGRDIPGTYAEEMQCEWLAPWEPGVIEAVAYRNGQEVARASQTTASAPARLEVKTDNHDLDTDGKDVAIVTVSQTDAQGNFYPFGENRIAFRLEGPARLLSLENGNPVDTEPNVGATTRRTFFGLTRAFIQATQDSGDVSILVGSINGERRQLTSNRVTIDLERIALRGPLKKGHFKIHYTLDGTEPTKKSLVYKSSIAIALPTKVRALVLEKGKEILTLEEDFAADAGLHWLAKDELDFVAAAGLQAEDSALGKAAKIAHFTDGHYGTGYVELDKNGTLDFYQENDGSHGHFALRIRYLSTESSRIEVIVNGQSLGPIDLPASPKDWSQYLLPTPMQSGGNAITLTLLQGNELLIDEIEISNRF